MFASFPHIELLAALITRNVWHLPFDLYFHIPKKRTTQIVNTETPTVITMLCTDTIENAFNISSIITKQANHTNCVQSKQKKY
jgi:hypothetical protein